MSDEHVINIADGRAEFIYDDALAGAVADMDGRVTRASHVEPHPTRPGWLADMTPSGGPVLSASGPACRFVSDGGAPVCPTHGAAIDRDDAGWHCAATSVPFPFGVPLGTWALDQCEPFATRADALEAERAWLREHRGL